MLGFFVFFALILLCFEFLIILGCGERKRNFKKKEDSDVLERFKKRNDAIWKANIAPLEISRRLRYLANDIELARTKSDIDKIRINHFVVRYE